MSQQEQECSLRVGGPRAKGHDSAGWATSSPLGCSPTAPEQGGDSNGLRPQTSDCQARPINRTDPGTPCSTLGIEAPLSLNEASGQWV